MEQVVIDGLAAIANSIHTRKGNIELIPQEVIETVIEAEKLLMENLKYRGKRNGTTG